MGLLKKIEEKEIVKTPVFTVVKKTFEGTDFQPVGLNCHDWVSIVAVDNEKILENPVCVFVEQTRWGEEIKTIEFPCGTVEDNENPRDAAIREFKEETGIDIDSKSLYYCGQFNPNPAYFNNTMHVYLYVNKNLINKFLNRGKQHLDKDEDCKVFIDRLSNMKPNVKKGAMGIAILNLAQEVGGIDE